MPEVERRQLHVVTDAGLPRSRLLGALEQAAACGVDWVHVRDPAGVERDLFELARDVIGICRPRGVRVAVNTCVGVALGVRADGVQVTHRGMPVGVVRSIARGMVVGASVHSSDEAGRAASEGADWLLLGNLLATGTHPGRAGLGLEMLQQVVRAAPVPVIAIGGITASGIPGVLQAGAAGVAVVSAILRAEDPGRATIELRQTLDRSA